MIDFTDDDLILSTFIQLCTKYIAKKGHFEKDTSNYAITFLKENHIDSKCMSFFMNPSEQDGSWLMRDSATYLNVYCEWHEEDFLKDKDLCSQIMDRLSNKFKTTSRSQWQTEAALGLPLMVLGSLPRRLLLPSDIDAIDGLSPLFDVPAYSHNPHVLMNLKRIFCESRGPYKAAHGTLTAGHRADRMSARVLYLKYVERYPNFWEKVIQIADDEYNPTPALSAINFMYALVDADWEPVDQSLVPYLPSEEELLDMREAIKNPRSGLEAMLVESGMTMPIATYFFSTTKPQDRNRPEVRRPIASPMDSISSSVPMVKVQLTIHIRDLLEKEVMREGHAEMMEDLLRGFNEKVQSNARDMREKTAVQGGTDSVATMRR